jgi:hypothetical protein
MGLSPKPMAAGGGVLARREFHRRWADKLPDMISAQRRVMRRE